MGHPEIERRSGQAAQAFFIAVEAASFD